MNISVTLIHKFKSVQFEYIKNVLDTYCPFGIHADNKEKSMEKTWPLLSNTINHIVISDRNPSSKQA